MNPYVVGPSGFSTLDEIRAPLPVYDGRPVICPKPRRLGFHFSDQPVRSLRWHISHQADVCDSKPPSDVVDIIIKGGGSNSGEQITNSQVVSSSPPFFTGSPPSRVANPLIQDARFGEATVSPFSPPAGGGFSSSSSPNSSRKGAGCVRVNFGNNPAVRIEGFDCLERDRRHCSIPALA